LRVPLSWLHEYVDFDLSAEELAELFSLRSQEVDGVDRLGVTSGEVVVGEVVEFGPHPNADRLSVAKVDTGGQEVQIVAGAPNPYPGVRVPVVLPGSTLADGRKLEKAKLRGLESYGMMMSERELGISGDHEGILLLDENYEVGRLLQDYFPVGETVLEIDVMPNRPDLWGMIGVARELAAILKTTFRIPEPRFGNGGKPTSAYGLRVEAEDLCPRYDLRRVSSLESGPLPVWMRRRIYAAGMRPVNGIVDATNYAMLETGQPIHAFDATKVREGIVVRRALAGERLTLLDGSARALDPETLVIADEEQGLAIAGVMGAQEAEINKDTKVDGKTTDVLLEVATFNGRNVLETSQNLGLRTDASGRFERGLDPNMVSYAMDRVTGLLAEHCGGRAAPDTLSHYPEPVRPWEVSLRLSRAELLLGMPIDEDEAAQRLKLLGCEVRREDGCLLATVPTFRRDLRREADLIEEVGRLVGLEKAPERLPGVEQPGGLTPTQKKLRRLRYLLADLGLAETVTYPFGPDRWSEDLDLENGDAEWEPLKLRNPLSAEASNLRTMLLPGLLDAAARNRSFGARGGALFEVGHVFEPKEQPPKLRETALRYRLLGDTEGNIPTDLLMGVSEAHKVAGLLVGTVLPPGWNVPAFTAGFFEVKGLVERLVPGAVFKPHSKPFLHPGRAATVLVGNAEVGWVGELHPEVAERFGLEGWPVCGFELDLAATDPDPVPRFAPFYNVPAVSMDLAVVVGEEVRVGDMLEVVGALGSPILAGCRVFDVYEGSQVLAGKKSVALNFIFQSEQTLNDAVVKEELDRISERLREAFGAEVRGG
jgi:phenylalanyl-tRNA synthetase beta chain